MDKAEPPNLNHGQLNYPLPVGNQMSSVTMASSSGPGLWTGIPSEDDQRLREVGMAALAALAQNPPLYEENEHGVVDQVVAAVTGINQPMFRSSIMDMETSDKNSESDVDGLSCPGSLETEDQAHASTPSDQDISGVRRVNNTSEYNIASDAEMDHLGQRIESELNTMMDYDSPRETSASSPASDLEENIEEMLRFYPGEEEFFRRRNPSLSGSQSTHPPRANLDLRDFYIRVHYDNIDPSHPSHFEDPQAMAEPMNELDLIEAVPFLHTNSMFCLFLSSDWFAH